jgi:hypothetical protein
MGPLKYFINTNHNNQNLLDENEDEYDDDDDDIDNEFDNAGGQSESDNKLQIKEETSEPENHFNNNNSNSNSNNNEIENDFENDQISDNQISENEYAQKYENVSKFNNGIQQKPFISQITGILKQATSSISNKNISINNQIQLRQNANLKRRVLQLEQLNKTLLEELNRERISKQDILTKLEKANNNIEKLKQSHEPYINSKEAQLKKQQTAIELMQKRVDQLLAEESNS